VRSKSGGEGMKLNFGTSVRSKLLFRTAKKVML
jgi:hypothetical protein